MSTDLSRRLGKLGSRLGRLPEAEEPPPTTLQVLGRSGQEQDWQRLLFHFLTPDGAHGLDHALLEHFLKALSERSGIDYAFSRFDLEDIRMELEVITSKGRPDAVLWASEDWFICFELKVNASEDDDQTQRYADVESFQSIGLGKSDVPEDGHHYVFLAPEGASSPEAEAFVHVPWEWVGSVLQSFLADSHGEYPTRTTAQINDFRGTIRNELTMTEYQENQDDKAKLYIDHYEEISEVKTAFEGKWREFESDWGTRLAQTMDAAEIVTDSEVPEEYVSVDLEMKNGKRVRWIFRQGKSDWSWMFPKNWWTKLDENRPTPDAVKPNARVGFLHRLDWHYEEAVKDHELVFYLRNAPSGYDGFYHNFAERFNTDNEIPQLLPSGTSRGGVKSNVLEARYDINVDLHDDFFDAYIEALTRAMNDHAVSSPAFVSKIDTLYQTTVDEDVCL